MIAYGGRGGSGAGSSRTGGSGGALPSITTRATATGFDDREYKSSYLILGSTTAQGTPGSSGTTAVDSSAGYTPSAQPGPHEVDLRTTMSYDTYLSSCCYHSYIRPISYFGGFDGSIKSNSAGGGAGSLLGTGGNGNVQAAGSAGGYGAGGGGAGGQAIGGG